MIGQTLVTTVGYACLDSATVVGEFRGVDATSILERPVATPTPGVGGVAHLAVAVAATGASSQVVSWVGTDDAGKIWRAHLEEAGVDTDPVVISGQHSPSATLIEVRSGGTICLFHPGDCHRDRLSEQQRAAILAARWVLLTVAPKAITQEILDILPRSARLAWAVKHDEDAYDRELIMRLIARADVVSYSRQEREYLGNSRDARPPGAIHVETRGSDGVAWRCDDIRGEIPVTPIHVDDTTGAGDTFVGALVGHLAAEPDPTHPATLQRVVESASKAAGDMLRRRAHQAPDAGEAKEIQP